MRLSSFHITTIFRMEQIHVCQLENWQTITIKLKKCFKWKIERFKHQLSNTYCMPLCTAIFFKECCIFHRQRQNRLENGFEKEKKNKKNKKKKKKKKKRKIICNMGPFQYIVPLLSFLLDFLAKYNDACRLEKIEYFSVNSFISSQNNNSTIDRQNSCFHFAWKNRKSNELCHFYFFHIFSICIEMLLHLKRVAFDALPSFCNENLIKTN